MFGCCSIMLVMCFIKDLCVIVNFVNEKLWILSILGDFHLRNSVVMFLIAISVTSLKLISSVVFRLFYFSVIYSTLPLCCTDSFHIPVQNFFSFPFIGSFSETFLRNGKLGYSSQLLLSSQNWRRNTARIGKASSMCSYSYVTNSNCMLLVENFQEMPP